MQTNMISPNHWIFMQDIRINELIQMVNTAGQIKPLHISDMKELWSGKKIIICTQKQWHVLLQRCLPSLAKTQSSHLLPCLKHESFALLFPELQECSLCCCADVFSRDILCKIFSCISFSILNVFRCLSVYKTKIIILNMLESLSLCFLSSTGFPEVFVALLFP